MNSDDKEALIGWIGFPIIILFLIIIVYFGISRISTSYEEGKKERAIKKIEDDKIKDIALKQKIAEDKKIKENKDARKKAKHLAELRESPGWDNEFGNLMYEANGDLKDPVPEDGYSAEQNYWFLIYALFAYFVMFAGMGTKNPIMMMISCVVVIIASIIMWSW